MGWWSPASRSSWRPDPRGEGATRSACCSSRARTSPSGSASRGTSARTPGAWCSRSSPSSAWRASRSRRSSPPPTSPCSAPPTPTFACATPRDGARSSPTPQRRATRRHPRRAPGPRRDPRRAQAGVRSGLPKYGQHLTREEVAELSTPRRSIDFVRAYLDKATNASPSACRGPRAWISSASRVASRTSTASSTPDSRWSGSEGASSRHLSHARDGRPEGARGAPRRILGACTSPAVSSSTTRWAGRRAPPAAETSATPPARARDRRRRTTENSRVWRCRRTANDRPYASRGRRRVGG